LKLYYLRARYFNPLSGRFLSRDSATGISRSPATAHKYLYVGSNPVNRIDPSGHDSILEYAFSLARDLPSLEGAKSFGCAAGIAGVMTAWLFGMESDSITQMQAGLSLFACGMQFTEAGLESGVGYYTNGFQIAGDIDTSIGIAKCGATIGSLVADLSETEPLSESQIQAKALHTFVDTFECLMFIGTELIIE
jgi:hypothetical protein